MKKMLIGLYEFQGTFFAVRFEPEPGIVAFLSWRQGRYELLGLHSFENMQEDSPAVQDRYLRQQPGGSVVCAVYPMPGFTRSERVRVLDEIWQELAMCQPLAS